MKLLFVIDSLGGGGAERVLSSLANEFSRQKDEVDILLTSGTDICYEVTNTIKLYDINGNELKKDALVCCSEKVSSEHIPVSFCKKKSSIETLHSRISEHRDCRRKGKLLATFVNSMKYDVVISFLTTSNIIASIAALQTSAKVIISERCSPIDTGLSTMKGKWTIRQYRKADNIVFQTNEAMGCYPKALRKKGVIIPNPILQNLPKPFAGERKKEIVTFGRFSKQKNLTLLVEAFYNVHQIYPDYSLHLIGSGSEKETIIALVESLGIQNSVKVEEYRADVHEVIKDCMVYVSSSNYEGISNSMLEAMAIGLPSICTDCPVGGARMAITDMENGLLIPVGDRERLSKAIKLLIDDSSLRIKIGENATKIRKKYSLDNIVKLWREVIESETPFHK